MHIFVNPGASGGNGSDQFSRILPLLKDRFEAFTFVITRNVGEMEGKFLDLTRQAGRKEIAIAGGDGTINLFVNLIMKSATNEKVSLGILPTGTGNSFIRDFEVENLEAAVQKLRFFPGRKVDLLKIIMEGPEETSREVFAINTVHIGLFADSGATANTLLKKLGPRGYPIAFFYNLLKYHQFTFGVELDQLSFSLRTPMMTIANSKFTGGTMMISPSSVCDDGLTELVTFEGMSRVTIMKNFKRVYAGTHLALNFVCVHQSRSIALSSAKPFNVLIDGESGYRCTKLKVKIIPGALCLALPH